MKESSSGEANGCSVYKLPTFMGPKSLLLCSQEAANPWHCETLVQCWLFLWWRIIHPIPNTQAEGPPTISCPCLLIQCIHIHTNLPQLEATSSIHNLRMHQAAMKRDSLAIDIFVDHIRNHLHSWLILTLFNNIVQLRRWLRIKLDERNWCTVNMYA